MKLNLKQPIVFFDLETTGLNIQSDKIVEICYLKVFPNGNEVSKTFRINPEIHISKESSGIHGIYDEDVKDSPTFKDISSEVIEDIRGCDLAGFNSNRFDIPVLAEELLRVGVVYDLRTVQFVDVQTIFHKKEQRTLSAAYKFYCQKDLENAHSAEADTRATYEVLLSQLDKYTDLENSIDFLSDYSTFNKSADFSGRIIYNNKKQKVFNFGKHKGKKVTEVLEKEPSYYDWMLKGNFSLDTKNVLTQIKKEWDLAKLKDKFKKGL